MDMLNASIDWSYKKMYTKCQEFQKEGSGWTVDEVLHLKLLIGKYKPLKSSQYFELPKKIAKTHCILNIQNKDDKCFLWSILAHLHVVPPHQNGYRVEKYIPYVKWVEHGRHYLSCSCERGSQIWKKKPEWHICQCFWIWGWNVSSSHLKGSEGQTCQPVTPWTKGENTLLSD